MTLYSGLVGLQQLLVYDNRVVNGRRKKMLGNQPVEDSHDFDFGTTGNRPNLR
jgi:hypothetical protein